MHYPLRGGLGWGWGFVFLSLTLLVLVLRFNPATIARLLHANKNVFLIMLFRWKISVI